MLFMCLLRNFFYLLHISIINCLPCYNFRMSDSESGGEDENDSEDNGDVKKPNRKHNNLAKITGMMTNVLLGSCGIIFIE